MLGLGGEVGIFVSRYFGFFRRDFVIRCFNFDRENGRNFSRYWVFRFIVVFSGFRVVRLSMIYVYLDKFMIRFLIRGVDLGRRACCRGG